MKVSRFYADIPAGSIGQVTKKWNDPSGCVWVRMLFGKNLAGKKIKRVIPIDCLEDIYETV